MSIRWKKTNIKPDLPSFFIIITLRMKNTSSISFQFMIHIKRLSLCGRVEIYSCEYHKVWSWMNHSEKNEWKIPSSSIALRTLKYFWHWFDKMHRGKFGFYSNSWLKFTDRLHLHVTVEPVFMLAYQNIESVWLRTSRISVEKNSNHRFKFTEEIKA